MKINIIIDVSEYLGNLCSSIFMDDNIYDGYTEFEIMYQTYFNYDVNIPVADTLKLY